MRAGPIVAGAIILVIGIAAAVAGIAMRSVADACTGSVCMESEFIVLGAAGSAMLLGGSLSALAGIGLIVAGIVAPDKARAIPVTTAPATRPCPQCSKPAARDAHYCPSCGSAIAPVLES